MWLESLLVQFRNFVGEIVVTFPTFPNDEPAPPPPFILVPTPALHIVAQMIVFEGDYFSVYDTIDERVNNLTELFLAEEALFPNIPEIEEREGHCNDTYALNLVAGFYDTYDAGIDSAKMQILWVGCNTSHNDAPSMNGLADFCADLNASLVDLNNLPDHEDTNFTTPTNTPPPSSEVQVPLRFCDPMWVCII